MEPPINIINPINKITSGITNTFLKHMSTKEGISIFFLVLTMFLLMMWISGVLVKYSSILTIISFIITCFMCWITWIGCDL